MSIMKDLNYKKLLRYPKRGYIGGVCHGFGELTGVDPIIWRIIAVFNPFTLIYILLWIFVKKGE